MIFLISVFIGIVVSNIHIDSLKFSSVNKEWTFVMGIDLKNIKDYKVEILIIICLIGIITSWIFTAYKATNHISPRQLKDYFQLSMFILTVDRISTALCGVGFIILGLRKSKI